MNKPNLDSLSINEGMWVKILGQNPDVPTSCDDSSLVNSRVIQAVDDRGGKESVQVILPLLLLVLNSSVLIIQDICFLFGRVSIRRRQAG